jgi:pyruvate,orthophosphate dikinase
MFYDLKAKLGVTEDLEVPAESLKSLCDDYKAHVIKQTGKQFPQDPHEQLDAAITAVFRSWNNERAIIYRRKDGEYSALDVNA